MSDETPTLTTEELETIKLAVDFNKAAQAELHAVQQEFSSLMEEKTEEVKKMSDEDIDAAVAKTLVTPAMTEAEAEEQAEQIMAQVPEAQLPMVLMMNFGVDPSSLGEDTDYKQVLTGILMQQNAGVTEEQAKDAAYNDMSRNQKRGMLAEKFAIEAMGEHPQEKLQKAQQDLMDKMGVDVQAINAELQAMAQKYGPDVVNAEMQKMSGPTIN